jgi:hypothetical protein
MAALAVDPGDDRVRLGAVLHARAQDVLHRLTEYRSSGFYAVKR